jgi:ketosteroid isomerase-like protein
MSDDVAATDRSELLRGRIETYMARFSANDREGWLDLFADDAWIEDPVGTPRRNGRAEIGAFWDDSHAVPEAIELVPLGILTVAGDEAAFTMQARAGLRPRHHRRDELRRGRPHHHHAGLLRSQRAAAARRLSSVPADRLCGAERAPVGER